jgi:hypothetical protein
MLLVASSRSVGRHPYVVPAKLRGYQATPTIDTAYVVESAPGVAVHDRHPIVPPAVSPGEISPLRR